MSEELIKIESVLVIGAVSTTAATVKALVRHRLKVSGVLGHEPEDRALVSGWCDLRRLSLELDIDYKSFQRINDSEYIDWARERNPDLIFAVGLSQLLGSAWLEMPKVACVGFHPTKLPRGRGRAPIAWIVLEEREGAATFFVMGQGADDGPILAQEHFTLAEQDDARSVELLILRSIELVLDEWLPKLKKGEWSPIPQDEENATWYGKRAPEDGLIDWNQSALEIDRLIKASAPPHPGAYTYLGHTKLFIYSSCVETALRFKGVTGRVLATDEHKGCLVQAGRGLVWISEIVSRSDVYPRVGQKLGMSLEDVMTKIWNAMDRLND